MEQKCNHPLLNRFLPHQKKKDFFSGFQSISCSYLCVCLCETLETNVGLFPGFVVFVYINFFLVYFKPHSTNSCINNTKSCRSNQSRILSPQQPHNGEENNDDLSQGSARGIPAHNNHPTTPRPHSRPSVLFACLLADEKKVSNQQIVLCSFSYSLIFYFFFTSG